MHRSTRELELAIRRYVDLTNAHPKPFVWTKTADEILASVARFCQRISDSTLGVVRLGPSQRVLHRSLERVPRRALPAGSNRTRRRVHHPGRIRRLPATRVRHTG